MQIGLKLLTTQREMKTLILQALVDELKRPLRIAVPHIKSRLKELISISIHSSPEFQSLIGGRLQAELGVPDVYSRLSDMLDIWLNTINVIPSPPAIVGNHIEGGIKIDAIDASFSDVLSLPSASYTTKEGETIPWLSWLMEAGHQFLVRGYKVSFEPQGLANSRTGLAVMTVAPDNAWRVPKEYAGTIDNNFITRAVQNIEPRLADIIQQEIESKI